METCRSEAPPGPAQRNSASVCPPTFRPLTSPSPRPGFTSSLHPRIIVSVQVTCAIIVCIIDAIATTPLDSTPGSLSMVDEEVDWGMEEVTEEKMADEWGRGGGQAPMDTDDEDVISLGGQEDAGELASDA